ncbi:TraB family protein, partial [Candidatus Woesearchaeota archaeon]
MYNRVFVERLKIIGTSHIAIESVDEVRLAIDEFKPDIVAVELDRARLDALLQDRKAKADWRMIRKVGLKGWLFAILGSWIERKLGSKVGVSPGSEMLAAVRRAGEVGARVALIDQKIDVTLRRFSSALTWREKWNFLVDLVKGFFGKGVKIDLARVPEKELIETLLKDVKKRYPNVYRVLVKERNDYMARRIAGLLTVYPDSRVLAVVGAGHEQDIRELVKKYL